MHNASVSPWFGAKQKKKKKKKNKVEIIEKGKKIKNT